MDENKRLGGKFDEILQTMKDQVALQKESNRINDNLTLTIEHFIKLLGPELEKTDAIARVEAKRKAFYEKYKGYFVALEEPPTEKTKPKPSNSQEHVDPRYQRGRTACDVLPFLVQSDAAEADLAG